MHFTYDTNRSRTELCQGDLIKRTQAVDRIFEEVHRHYLKDDYRHFIVLTQSCDLSRRDGAPCKSRYITLASVRPLRLAIQREIERLQYEDEERQLGFCESGRKAKLDQFVERLLNNNEPNYFFLYREPLHGIREDHCAFLQLSVAVKANLHYDALLDAKLLQLRDSFQHKLGQLVGMMYSRIATEDWLPDNATEDVFQARVREIVDDPELVLWLEKDVHSRVLAQLRKVERSARTVDSLMAIVAEVKAQKEARRADMIRLIGQTLSDCGVSEEAIEHATKRLENNSDFRSRVK